MQSVLGSKLQRSDPVDLKLTHLNWSPEATLIHFQGHCLTICDLDYNILQVEIQRIPKTNTAVDIGEFCLVEDLTSGRWCRGRVQNQTADLFDVFLIDYGNVLSVDIAHISSCSNDLFILPPKVLCGFLANIMLLQGCSHSVVEVYFSSLIGKNITGYIQALLPYNTLLLEAPDINNDLVRHGFGRHVDTDTFLLLVEMLTEVPHKQNTEPLPDLLIEKPRGQEFSFKPSGLQGYKDILSYCGPRLSFGTRAKMRVTAAVNPGLFYCQMTSMETSLEEMSKKLAAVNELQTKVRSHKTPENLGLLCAVKGKDEKWHRGFVQLLPVNSHLRVFFIDYGFFESVKVENVHKLPPDIFSPQIMAIPCSLSSLSDEDEEVRTQQLSLLKQGLLGRVLDVEITDFNEEKHLHSVTVISAEDNHVKKPEPIQELPRLKVESISETEDFSPQCSYLYYEKIMGEALGKTLEEEKVQVNSVFVGYVEHVQNPSQFWIRTQKRNDEFQDMMTKLTENFSQVKLDEDVLMNPERGALCCAVYEEDMHFYRGVVTDTLEHGAEILFIDFGNMGKVPHMLIKKMPETFASKSAFAFCCTLFNVFPLGDVWTSDNTDFFRQAVSNKALLVHVVQKRKNKLVVELHDYGSAINQSITELLVSSKQADYWNIAVEPVVQNNTDMTEKTRCLKYSVASDINGNMEQLKDCEEEGKTNQTEKTQAPTRFKALNIKPGCNFAVCCSYIKSLSDFWCQPLDKLPALEELMDKVEQYYSTHTVPLQSGDSCCVAKSPHDGRWYRAVITETQNSHARVMAVDYGISFQIKKDSLQAIMPEYVYLEGQAFRCTLYNLIEPANPKRSQEVCKSLKDLVLHSTNDLRCNIVLQLNVKDKGLCNAVELYNTQSQQSITDLLLEQGLSREVTISTKQLPTVFPESFVYSSYDLSPGNEEHVYITHVDSQWEVYCHLEKNAEIIEELEKNISEESKQMLQSRTREQVVRKLSLAKYFDGKWYRALVYPVPSPLHLGVFFVDYGNANISEKTHVMFIPRDSAKLLYTPMQAVKCHLASVPKEEVYADVKEWLDGTVLNKQVRVVIVGKNEDGSFDVELFDGDVNINEKIKELILSHSPKPKIAMSFDMSKTKHRTLHTRNAKTPVELRGWRKEPASKSPTMNAYKHTQVGSALCRMKKRTTNVQGKAQNKNTKVHQQNGYHDASRKSERPQRTEEIEIPQLLCLPEIKVSEGFRAKCFVSHINSVNSFFLQLSEDEPAILKMGEDLNSSSFRDSMKTATSLRINDLVLAEYEEDGRLYRSAVKDCEESVKIEFVDYGNTAVTGKLKIYSIPKEFLSQPRFSIPCSLLDTSMYENDSSFTKAVIEKPLMVEFVHRHKVHWEVKFEIVDETVGLPAALEAAVESSTETEKEEESCAESSEIQEKMGSCEEEDRKKVSKNETTKSEKATVDGKNRMLMPQQHGRTASRDECDSEENQRKDTKSSAKVYCTDEIIPLTIQAKDTESGAVLSVLSKCKAVAEEDVKQGLKCLAQVEKERQWHRAIVQEVGLEKSKIVLVNHGITEEIPNVSFRQQCSNLTKIPNLAVLCKVNCAEFGEGEDAHELWCETQNEKAEGELNLDTSPSTQLAFAPIDIDKVYTGFAAAVTSPFEFCVVLEDFLLIINKVSIMLDDLPEQMSPLPEALLVPGKCCLLKSDTKNKWCRAEIVHTDSTAVLNLVDYGHYECIPCKDRSKLKSLPAEMADLPKVTYPCILRGVKPVGADGQWTDEAAVFFQHCLYQKNLQIFFREFVSNTHWKVDILADGVYVAKELVDAGHASYIDVMLGLRFQKRSPRKAAPVSPDREEECGQEDEGSDGKLNLSVDSADEAEGKMPLSLVSGSCQCSLM